MNQSIACLCPKFREKYGINKGSVIGYGIGLYYHQIKNLYTDLCLDYVMDIKWRNDPPQEYEGVPVITEDDLLKIKDPIILAFPRSASILCEVRSSFGARARVFDAAEAYGSEKLISGSEINRTATHGEIRDDRGNLIVCEGNVPDQLCIKFFRFLSRVVSVFRHRPEGNTYIIPKIRGAGKAKISVLAFFPVFRFSTFSTFTVWRNYTTFNFYCV